MITKRKIMLNVAAGSPVMREAMKIMIGLNAKPVSIAAGTASSALGPRGTPKIVITIRNAVAVVSKRKPIQPNSPTSTSQVRSGVASIAS